MPVPGMTEGSSALVANTLTIGRVRDNADSAGLLRAAQHPQVAAATDLHRLPVRCRGRPGRLAHGVGQRLEVVAGRADVGGVRREPQDLPATGGREPLGVGGAQVVAVRLGIGRERRRR